MRHDLLGLAVFHLSHSYLKLLGVRQGLNSRPVCFAKNKVQMRPIFLKVIVEKGSITALFGGEPHG